MASVSKQLIDAVAAGDDSLVLGSDDLASSMSAVMEHVEANGFEQCKNPQCTLCYPYVSKGN